MRKIYVPQAQANLGIVIHAKMIEVVDDCHFCHLLHAVRSSNGCISVHRTKQGCWLFLLIHHVEDRRTQLID